MNVLTSMIAATVLALAPLAAAAGGHAKDLITVKSAHDVATTIDRLAAAVEGAGATVFARVDHAAGAAKIGEDLRPTQLLMFGNPKLGTPALQGAQTIGMDLPLRVVAWEDQVGETHLSYTAPAAMFARHGLPADHPTVAKITGALAELTGKAAQP